ncbi:ornithine carbamoyltransferase [Demequina sp. TTPB684]|uniref:ornithine carbamoyltransferase n=1 Tax=unclassified Demequina TaxID=2620311 RepID=UPI001CF566DE|nr:MULTISPECIES: ornithine carbamoyltransferase [unclassified Demequina]MCB2413037.1 ornithine carbamoyltransferase [Demequina sp. TTPB684]UPU89454.1 ornithine carbamoyltransferase [Demequina sp. TMPB413]
MVRHFLRDDDLTAAEQREVLELALAFRKNRYLHRPFEGPQAVAVLFDKPSTRTRVSFSAGIAELGGYPLVLDAGSSQMGRGESVADTARVLGRQVSAIVWRTFGQDRVEDMAEFSGVPVVNALTDDFHPCQILADLAAVADARGGVDALAGLTLAYVGDGANNMAHSYLLGGALAGMHVRVGAPEDYMPSEAVVLDAKALAAEHGGSVTVTTDHDDAVRGADIIATDTWISMGDENEFGVRAGQFESYQVNAHSLEIAAPGAQVLHCLPAYRGKEITAEVLDGPQSIVWLEAEYRLHAQKALLTWLAAHSGKDS